MELVSESLTAPGCNDKHDRYTVCNRVDHVHDFISSQDFVFPEDVSFSIGGPDTSKYMVIEMHYDNPVGVQGIVYVYSNGFIVMEWS